MYKIGEKVETPFGVGRVDKVFDSGLMVFLGGSKLIPLKDVKPYQSAHEKLIELGWEDKGFVELRHIYEKKYPYKFKEHIIIFPKSKFYLTSTNSKGHSVLINIELSRILTQYLEELEKVGKEE